MYQAVLRRRRLLVGLPLALAFITAVAVVVLPDSYTTEMSFLPAQSAATSSLLGLAAQFGVSVGGASTAATPDYYAEVLKSPELLRPLAEANYTVAIGGDTTKASFVDIYDKHIRTLRVPFVSQSYGDRLRDAMDELSDEVTVSTSTASGIVSAQVTTKWPDLSYQLSTRLVDLVNGLDGRRRMEQAAAESTFVESRLNATRADLARAEDSMEAFQLRNRQYQTDPQLSLEYARLTREVAIRQTLYTSLAQSFEQSRIDAVRNTPSVALVEEPRQPLVANKSNLVLKAILAFIVGLIIASALALALELLGAARRGSESPELEELKRAARNDLLRVIRPWRRPA